MDWIKALLIPTVVLAFVIAFNIPVAGDTVSWNTDSDGAWENPANWTNETTSTTPYTPTAGDTLNLGRSSATPTVTVNSDVSSAGMFEEVRLAINGTSVEVLIESDARIWASSIYAGNVGAATIVQQAGSTVTTDGTGGALAGRDIYIGRNGGLAEWTMFGGTLDAGRDLRIDGSGTSMLDVHQGATVKWHRNFRIGASDNGHMILRGGAVDGNALVIGSPSSTDGRLTIVGSQATISLRGNYTQDSTGTLTASLDNGGISTISATSGTVTLGGTLAATFNGGVALLTSRSHTLIDGTISGDFASTLDSTMWTTDTSSGYTLTLRTGAGSAEQAGVTATYTNFHESVFSPVALGHLEISGIDTGRSLTVYLDIDPGTGKTLGDVLAYLQSAGQDASLISMSGYDYDVALDFASPASDTLYLGWDWGELNDSATLSAVGVGAIPEPGTILLMVAGLGAVAVRRGS